MPGGNWNTFTIIDPGTRPGFYANFIADAIAGVIGGEQGVVCVPVTAAWGPIREFLTFETEAEALAAFTNYAAGNALFSVVEALRGGARSVLAYRVAASAAAVATLTLTDTAGSPADIVRIDAMYKGAYGNDLRVTVQVDPVDDTVQNLKVLDVSGTLLHQFDFTADDVDALVAAVAADTDNVYITATKLGVGDSTIAAISASALTGGDSGIAGVTNTDYVNAHAAMETVDFQVYALTATDSTTQDAAKLWVTQQRADGVRIQLVYGAAAAETLTNQRAEAEDANHEGIVYVGHGAYRDGVLYSGGALAPHIAGMVAGAGSQKSTTHAKVTSFDDAEVRLSNPNIKENLRHGVLTLVHNGEYLMIEKGINTLTNYSQEQNERFSKIRVISTLDAVAKAITKSADANWIGKIDNDEDGRKALIAAIKSFLDSLVRDRILRTGNEVKQDPERESLGDRFFLYIKIYPVDSIDYIYTTISVGQ